jgi:hypothetical protein
MTVARAHLVNPAVSRWYHCVLRCTRGASLVGDGTNDRKGWIESRLQELAGIFAVSVGAFAVLDDHVHVLVRLDPEAARKWSVEEVVRRWGRLSPPRDNARRPLAVSDEWVKRHRSNRTWVAQARQRLQSLGWFMKSLKEPLARMANRQEQTRGAFFEGRFKSIAILDDEALLVTCAYIDLSPLAAGIAKLPTRSAHTSIKARVDHVRKQDRNEDLNAARRGGAAGSKAAGLEEGHWLCPIEDRRRLDASREGMISGLSLGSYLLLVDFTARLYQKGAARPSRAVVEILDHLGSSVDQWQARLTKLSHGRLLGRYFATSRQRLHAVAKRLGLKRVPNLGGCPTS